MGYSILVGFSSAIETLCGMVRLPALHGLAYYGVEGSWTEQSTGIEHTRCLPQAYGAKNYAKMGILLQRAVIVCTTVYLMICVLWIFMGPLLRLAGVLYSPDPLRLEWRSSIILSRDCHCRSGAGDCV